MEYALCSELYGMLDVFQVVDRAAELGYHGLELAPFTLAQDLWSYGPAQQRSLARHARRRGVRIMGLHWLLRAPDGLQLMSADPAVSRRTFEFLLKIVEIAVNTGAKILTLGSPKQRSYGEGEQYERALERFVDMLFRLVPHLEAENLVLSLEPLEREFTNFITRTEEAVRIAENVGSKAIGVTLDTHFLRWEKAVYGTSVAEAFRTAAERLVHLHIQDDNRKAPGMGNDPLEEFTEAVKAVGWKRFISLETFVGETEAQADEIARKGIEFLMGRFG